MLFASYWKTILRRGAGTLSTLAHGVQRERRESESVCGGCEGPRVMMLPWHARPGTALARTYLCKSLKSPVPMDIGMPMIMHSLTPLIGSWAVSGV